MEAQYVIGLDYGSESARGVLIDVGSGNQVASHVYQYRHAIMTRTLPDGTPLPAGFALQNAGDYTEAAEHILRQLGRDRLIAGIGLGFTASSPLPCRQDGTPLSDLRPTDPHAYVKLWKHNAQVYADRINAGDTSFLAHFGGRVSGEWLLAKALQIAEEAPDVWAETERFIEGGDWLVWQLTGHEARGLGFAAYKAQFSPETGYPDHVVPGLENRLTAPSRVGTSAGELSAEWRRRTGIRGQAAVAVAVIDSHVVLPAIHAVKPDCFVGALGTSAAYLYLAPNYRPLPPGIEGVAFDGSMRDLWCYESGQPSFGDTLGWFARTFPRGADLAASFEAYNRDAAALAPVAGRLLALDWWGGNRVPFADGMLSGLLMGLTRETTAGEIYLALIEALCFGARTILDCFRDGGFTPAQVLMSSGLARSNPLVIQIMADVFDLPIEVPDIDNATAVGAAIHGAVAGGVVADYVAGSARFGSRSIDRVTPRPSHVAAYQAAYDIYRAVSTEQLVHRAMHQISALGASSKF